MMQPWESELTTTRPSCAGWPCVWWAMRPRPRTWCRRPTCGPSSVRPATGVRHTPGWPTVLRRLAGEGRRKSGRRSQRERDVAQPEQLPDPSDSIDARLDAHAQLLKRLQGLPDSERRVLFLRYGDDLSPAQIAEQLGEPMQSIKTRLRRAGVNAAGGPRYDIWRTWDVGLALRTPARPGGLRRGSSGCFFGCFSSASVASAAAQSALGRSSDVERKSPWE